MADHLLYKDDPTEEMRGTRDGFASRATGWAVSAAATLASVALVWHFHF